LLTAGILGVSRLTVHAQPRGKGVYDAHCVECHGSAGKGDGPSASYLVPRPRDFTSGKYKIRTTESGTVPSDEDLIGSVRRGLYGTTMPAWDRILPDSDINDVVQYVKSPSPQFATAPRVVTIGPGVSSSPASVARGQQVYDKLQCAKCHGTDGRGAGAVTTNFEDDWRQPLRASDLTEPWTFHGGATSRDIYLRSAPA
jgi:mono/diheme cytochrome c family protein